ncbi:hypothetical protein PPL_05972 [Heterostelium album PN500]|uniref:Uncharacterized protein n=1 Tax=Heterostelium pallidum (strain ATCC 26659 / Pp 5 / PN500) TaxID=670386 RepID=D3BBV2_HETP5|nr:hypothetical protein PPL_05972 [Heterostelium album PN500]EFA81135.1 hypothetical protein PPL_05972 [Heterostelium album PN500]|eukprot:XP_020433253.1 hypothetical protein PPL_05972 [Heterostelium album PN500]
MGSLFSKSTPPPLPPYTPFPDSEVDSKHLKHNNPHPLEFPEHLYIAGVNDGFIPDSIMHN